MYNLSATNKLLRRRAWPCPRQGKLRSPCQASRTSTPAKERLIFYCRTTSARTTPEGCAALRIVLVNVPRVSRSCEHFPDGFDLQLLLVPAKDQPCEVTQIAGRNLSHFTLPARRMRGAVKVIRECSRELFGPPHRAVGRTPGLRLVVLHLVQPTCHASSGHLLSSHTHLQRYLAHKKTPTPLGP